MRLAEVQGVQGLGAVGMDNRQNAAYIVVLAVPVTGSDLNGDFLTVISFQPIVLAGAGAVQADLGAAGGVFPEELLKNFIKNKRAECAEMARIPHPAEFERYYNL